MKKLLLLVLISNLLLGFDTDTFAKKWNWETTWTSAIEKSQRNNKPLLIFFAANPCSYCEKVKDELFDLEKPNEIVHRDYIPLIINIDNTNDDLPTRWKKPYAPLIRIIDKDENQIQRFFGSNSIEEIWTYLTKR